MALLPEESTAKYSTALLPTGMESPGEYVEVTVTCAELSEAVGSDQITIALAELASVDCVIVVVLQLVKVGAVESVEGFGE